jgi:hypothetical protein
MAEKVINGLVPLEMVGANGPSVVPSHDEAVFGSAEMQGGAPVEPRGFYSFKVVYTVGKLGLDDTGGIRVAMRMVSDAGSPQMSDPTAPNYVTAESNGEGQLLLNYQKTGGQRPFGEILTVHQRGGYLREGEQITIHFGDTSKGSPGMLAQTFVEGAREFRVMADVQATGNYNLVPGGQLALPVIPGPATCWKAVLPSLRRPDEPFHLGLKAEDKWGNPTPQAEGRLTLRPSLPVEGLPDVLDYDATARAMTLDGLKVSSGGTLYIDVLKDDELVARAGPLVVRDGSVAGFWGDLHGQTGETVGTNTIESYFDFARNKAFLDVTSHQANDFQIKGNFWDKLNALTAELDEPGRFTIFPGYEWSGNTAVGGDHNVFFRHEGRQIRRCSHALLEDQSQIGTDAHTLTDLFRDMRENDEDVVIYAHVGGRYANIHYDHDPLIETAVEVHSAWGTFEWVLTDGFELGRRVGLVANSDGHKGRPGASYPGDSVFGAYGGLTCFLTAENTRDAIFEAQRRRHHFGTTGCRMFMDVRVEFPEDSTLFERNPDAAPETPRHQVREAIMGDIVQTGAKSVKLRAEVKAHAGIERIEVRNGKKVLKTVRPYGEADLGSRVRVLWSGAEYRGRGRNTNWIGKAAFDQAKIKGFETINQWNPDSLFEQRGSNTVIWKNVTTGNYMGFDAWLDGDAGTLSVITNQGTLERDLSEIGFDDIELDAGGLERKIKMFRLPDAPLGNELDIDLDIDLHDEGDNQLWIAVYTEDGYQAWSSPLYVFK